MKKIISCLALSIFLYACKKTETTLQTIQEQATTSQENKGGSNFIVTTAPASSILAFTAVSGGSVSSSGGGTNVTDKGICISTSPNPTTANAKLSAGNNAGSFSFTLSGLSPATLYYVRAYAVKSTGTTYGNQISFTTIASNCNTDYGTVTDIDGNIYHTVTINSQVWMLENLKTTRYRDGTPVPQVTDGSWSSLTTGAYCNYNNDESYVSTYGRLYNWYAVGDPHNLAPDGWHVATAADITALINYFGGAGIAGFSLREAGTAHWFPPNYEAYNNCGWTGLPGGYRFGPTSGMGQRGMWWSSSDDSPNYPQTAKYLLMLEQRNVCGSVVSCSSEGWNDKRFGYSVRCIKD